MKWYVVVGIGFDDMIWYGLVLFVVKEEMIVVEFWEIEEVV